MDKYKINILLKYIIKFYEDLNILISPEELKYFENAIIKIDNYWLSNFNKIDKINYILLGEAPLWQDKEKYFYNPNQALSNFFHYNDFPGEKPIFKKPLDKKKWLLNKFNEIGFLILDISPYPLDKNFTSIYYNSLNAYEYKILINGILNIYFSDKIDLIKPKLNKEIKVFFRYKRLKKSFKDSIINIFNNKGITINRIIDISDSNRGNIDKNILKNILNI